MLKSAGSGSGATHRWPAPDADTGGSTRRSQTSGGHHSNTGGGLSHLGLTIGQLQRLLITCADNSALDPKHGVVCMDMTRPLNDYFIETVSFIRFTDNARWMVPCAPM